jgi:hypothetical protein
MWRKPASPKKQNKRHVQTKTKKKQRQHPFDKRVTFRKKMRDADVSHTALINKMADYLRNVLPDTK